MSTRVITATQAGRTVVVTSGAGAQSTPGSAHVHTQTAPSASWTVVHNLGRYVTTSVWVGGHLGLADVDYIDADTISIPFPAATSGVAVCT